MIYRLNWLSVFFPRGALFDRQGQYTRCYGGVVCILSSPLTVRKFKLRPAWIIVRFLPKHVAGIESQEWSHQYPKLQLPCKHTVLAKNPNGRLVGYLVRRVGTANNRDHGSIQDPSKR